MDTQSLQTFQQLVDFIKNIDSYDTIVAQIKTATDAHNAAYTLLSEGRTLVQFKDALDKTKARLDFERVEFDKSCKAQTDAFDLRVKSLDAREAELNDKAALVKGGELVNSAATELVQQKAAELDKRESDLNAQIAVNQAVASDLAARLALIKQAGA